MNVSPERALDAEQRDDVARLALGDVVHLVRVHADQARDLDLLLVGRAVEDEVALGDLALVDAHVGELTVAAVLELEREADERLVRVATRATTFSSFVVLVVRLVVDLGRVRQVVDDAVEQQLHALVLERRAAHHRRHLERERRAADGRA